MRGVNDREATFKQLVSEYPDSPMGHFSLGRLYVDAQRWQEAVTALSEAVRLDAGYAAAWVALGDAFIGLGDRPRARDAWTRALQTPHGQRDASLQGDLEGRIRDLDEF